MAFRDVPPATTAYKREAIATTLLGFCIRDILPLLAAGKTSVAQDVLGTWVQHDNCTTCSIPFSLRLHC
eukprot:2055166-Amphidinium_carterae.2